MTPREPRIIANWRRRFRATIDTESQDDLKYYFFCGRAIRHYVDGETQATRESIKSAMELRREAGHSGTRRRHRNDFVLEAIEANIDHGEGLYEDAIEHYNRAIEMAREHQRKAIHPRAHPEERAFFNYYSQALALLYIDRANTQIELGRPIREQDALAEVPEWDAASESLAEAARCAPGFSLVDVVRSNLYVLRHEWDAALRSRLASSKDDTDEGSSKRYWENVGYVERQRFLALQNDAESAEEESEASKEPVLAALSKSRAAFDEAGEHGWVGRSDFDLGSIRWKMGDLEGACGHFRTGSESYAKEESFANASYLKELEGNLCVELGRNNEAAEAYRKAAELAAKGGSDAVAPESPAILKAKLAVLSLDSREKAHALLIEALQALGEEAASPVAFLVGQVEMLLRDERRRRGLEDLLRRELERGAGSNRLPIVEGLVAIWASQESRPDDAGSNRGISAQMLPVVTPVVLDVEAAALTALDPDALLERMEPMRDEIREQYGVSIPGVRLRENDTDYPEGLYAILLDEVPLVSERVNIGDGLTTATERELAACDVVPDPVDFGAGPVGFRVSEQDAEKLDRAGLKRLPAAEIPVLHVRYVLMQHLDSFLDVQETANHLQRELNHPASRQILASPTLLTEFRDVLRALVMERTPIRNVLPLADEFLRLRSLDEHLGEVVASLRRLPEVVTQLWGNEESWVHLPLAPDFEASLRQQMETQGEVRFLRMEPEPCQDALTAIRAAVSDKTRPALVVADSCVRPLLRKLVELEFPELPVLWDEELRPFLLSRLGTEVTL